MALPQSAKKGFLEINFELLLMGFLIPVKQGSFRIHSVSILDFSLTIFNMNMLFSTGLSPFKNRLCV